MIIFSHMDCTMINEDGFVRQLLLSGDFDPMFYACLSSVDQSHAACVCIIRMHANQLILSLSVAGFGQYLPCHGLFWDPVANIIPCEKIL
jgi:hypothetical protein